MISVRMIAMQFPLKRQSEQENCCELKRTFLIQLMSTVWPDNWQMQTLKWLTKESKE